MSYGTLAFRNPDEKVEAEDKPQYYPLNIHIREASNGYLINVEGGWVSNVRRHEDHQWVFRTAPEVIDHIAQLLSESPRPTGRRSPKED